METNNEKVLEKLEINSRWTLAHTIFSVIWWIAEIICMKFTSYTEDYYGGYFGYKYIWGMPYYRYEREGENNFWWYMLLLGILITIVIAAIPFVIRLIYKFIAKRCQLTLTENQIYGVLKMPLSTRKIQMPIEKIDNVFTLNGILDKMLGGKTLKICSNSGAVKFHFVQNAEQFAAATIKRIEKIRKEEKNTQTVIQPQSNNAGNSSLTEKISELQKLKEQGILSQEEFEKKKQDLIEKF